MKHYLLVANHTLGGVPCRLRQALDVLRTEQEFRVTVTMIRPAHHGA